MADFEKKRLTSNFGKEKAEYAVEIQHAEAFLKSDEDISGYYCEQLKDIAQGHRKVLNLRLDDMAGFALDTALAEKIRANAFRYLHIFELATDAVIKEFQVKYNLTPSSFASIDILLHQRMSEQKRLAQEEEDADQALIDQSGEFPPELTRRFEVCFEPSKPSLSQRKHGFDGSQSLREVKGSQIGKLVTIKGIVTRVGEVLPRIVVACYLCESCGFEVYQPVVSREFTPLVDCIAPKCRIRNRKKKVLGSLQLREKYSQFVKYQEIKIQEMPDQVPIGNCPRSLLIEARGECTRSCTAGDVVLVTGIFLPEKPRQNRFNRHTFGSLLSSTYVRCMSVIKEKRAELVDAINSEELDNLVSSSMYERISQSIAPEIFGHEDVKKAILLQLVGGMETVTEDGMKIRGDINVALFGDPGVAKSQLLKHVTLVAPRAVYTTGKGSSGVGLTAAVTRDSFTGQVALEAGALVLADKGICCIDEFDKMDENDRSSIHEVMEQQTVSIAKAGITTTLNARTAVLAAANPLYGRYNKKISPQQNINLPASLLSRFDLLFLLIDKPSLERDRQLAVHVTHVHMHMKHPEKEQQAQVLPPKLIRAYIAKCKRHRPLVPSFESPNGRAFLSHIVEAYVEMRQQDVEDSGKDHSKSGLTPRHLLAILRLASAHARVRLGAELEIQDVDEAIRLVKASKSSLEDDEVDAVVERREKDDFMTKIFRVIRDLLEHAHSVRFPDVEDRILRMGFSTLQLRRTLEEYSREDVKVFYVTPGTMSEIRYV